MNHNSRSSLVAIAFALSIVIGLGFVLFLVSILVLPNASFSLRVVLSILGASLLGAAGFISGFRDAYEFALDFLEPSASSQAQAATEQNKSVLVVDDEEEWRDILRTVVKSAFPDITVHTARSLKEAKSKSSRQHYDLLILDMQLEKDQGVPHGLLFLDELRSRGGAPFSVIAVSGYPAEYGFRAGKQGVDFFIFKGTFDDDLFIAKVQGLLGYKGKNIREDKQ